MTDHARPDFIFTDRAITGESPGVTIHSPALELYLLLVVRSCASGVVDFSEKFVFLMGPQYNK